eukprot:6175675-Lingulodinium_polyedra.AAC.1
MRGQQRSGSSPKRRQVLRAIAKQRKEHQGRGLSQAEQEAWAARLVDIPRLLTENADIDAV